MNAQTLLPPLTDSPTLYLKRLQNQFPEAEITINERGRRILLTESDRYGNVVDVEILFDESLNAQFESWKLEHRGSYGGATKKRWQDAGKAFDASMNESVRFRGLDQVHILDSEGKRARFGNRKISGRNDLTQIIHAKSGGSTKDILSIISFRTDDKNQEYHASFRWMTPAGENLYNGTYTPSKTPFLKALPNSIVIGEWDFFEIGAITQLFEWERHKQFNIDAVYTNSGIVHSFMGKKVNTFADFQKIYDEDYAFYQEAVTVPLKLYSKASPYELKLINLPLDEAKAAKIRTRLARIEAKAEEARTYLTAERVKKDAELKRLQYEQEQALAQKAHEEKMRRISEQVELEKQFPKRIVVEAEPEIITQIEYRDAAQKPLSWTVIFSLWFWLGLALFIIGGILAHVYLPSRGRIAYLVCFIGFLTAKIISGTWLDLWNFYILMSLGAYVLYQLGWYHYLKDWLQLHIFLKSKPEEYKQAEQEWVETERKFQEAEKESAYWEQKYKEAKAQWDAEQKARRRTNNTKGNSQQKSRGQANQQSSQSTQQNTGQSSNSQEFDADMPSGFKEQIKRALAQEWFDRTYRKGGDWAKYFGVEKYKATYKEVRKLYMQRSKILAPGRNYEIKNQQLKDRFHNSLCILNDAWDDAKSSLKSK